MDDPSAHRKPSPDQLKRWNAERVSEVNAQIAAVAKEATAAVPRSLTEDAIRKRREREQKRAAAVRARAIAEGADPDSLLADAVFSPSLPATQPTERPGTPSGSNPTAAVYTVTVPASSVDELDWYSPESSSYTTLEAAKTAGVWLYPSTPFERAKCKVFQDLWEKGNFMGGGIKFGADFLVYPGTSFPFASLCTH